MEIAVKVNYSFKNNNHHSGLLPWLRIGYLSWLSVLVASLLPQPAVDIAEGVDGSPDAYIISYNDTTQSIGSIECVNGPCSGTLFPPSSVVGPYTASATARNVVGEGPADTSGPISK